jgi:hypothetical protein
MKRIKLIHIAMPDFSSHYIRQKMYSVTLGNSVNKWFSNRKDALRYLATINRDLNLKLAELNYIYGFIFSEYRKNWYYFESTMKGNDNKINSLFQSINKSFELTVERSHYENGNHFTFSHLYKIIADLNQVGSILIEIMTDKKFYADVQRLNVFLSMLRFNKSEIEKLGKNFKIDSVP